MIVGATDQVTDTLCEAYRHLGLAAPGPVRPWNEWAHGGVLVPAGAAVVIESAGLAAARSAPALGKLDGTRSSQALRRTHLRSETQRIGVAVPVRWYRAIKPLRSTATPGVYRRSTPQRSA